MSVSSQRGTNTAEGVLPDVAPYDPRRVANLMLSEAKRTGLKITHLALQKLLYFAHGRYLIQHDRPLVSGYFEVWEHGPVHPAVYKAFKSAQQKPIDFFAESVNLVTGESSPILELESNIVCRLVQETLNSHGAIPAGRLVEITHAKNAPWRTTKNAMETSFTLRHRIKNEVIKERFRYHKVSMDSVSKNEEIKEDEPLA